MDLAFPLPEHLPRAKPHGNDNLQATAILTAMAETSPLTPSATSTWIKQLDAAIMETKSTIHSRIQQDLNAFERQLDSSKSIQRRLLNLSSNVDQLQAELNGSENAVLPNILRVLRHHSALTQRSLDADMVNISLRHLKKCKQEYQQLSTLAQEGRLPDARSASAELQTLVDSLPTPLAKSKVVQDLNSLLRATKDRIQEQLLQAYSTCVTLTDSQFTIKHEHSQHLALLSILGSITTESLLSALAALRKEILMRYVVPALEGKRRFESTQPMSLDVHIDHAKSPFHELSTLFAFLHNHLLTQIPEISRKPFASSFYVPLTEEIQNKVLLVSIPTSTTQLPAFLKLIQEATSFEKGAIKMGFFTGVERRIEMWGQSAQSHYEKKRRTQFIEEARGVLLMDMTPPVKIDVEVVQETIGQEATTDPAPLKDEMPQALSAEPVEDVVDWGFDDEEPDGTKNYLPETPKDVGSDHKEEEEKEPEENGWGFDEDEEMADQDPALDPAPERRGADPWGDEWDDTPMEAPGSSAHPPNQTDPAPGPRLSQSGKATVPTPIPVKVRESYLVSHAVTVIARISTNAFDEGMALVHSRAFTDMGFASSHPTVLLSTAPSGFDLFRALYSIQRAPELQRSLSAKLQYSNDCKFLSETARKLRTQYDADTSVKSQDFEQVRTRFEEVADKLDVISTSWFDESIEEETHALLNEYSGAGGFRDLSYDVRFSEAQNSIKSVKDRIILLSKELKIPLTTTLCYNTLGTIIDTVLDCIMQDVFSLRDISEVESERIAGLCLLLHPLDTIFPELENGISTVASYVPLWLKFTYLSDILEGSMADISSWLEAGHLVDYEAEELCRLMVALFAESPLRQATIVKIRATASG